VGPTVRLDAVKRKISCPCREPNPGCPARSPTLLCGCYVNFDYVSLVIEENMYANYIIQKFITDISSIRRNLDMILPISCDFLSKGRSEAGLLKTLFLTIIIPSILLTFEARMKERERREEGG
jgi:hypothetical protein